MAFKVYGYTTKSDNSYMEVFASLVIRKRDDARLHNTFGSILQIQGLQVQTSAAGLGGSVGCAVRLETRRSRVQPPPSSATFFRGD